MKEKKNKRIHIFITVEMLFAIEKLAKELGTTKSQLIRDAVEIFMRT